MNRKSLGLPLFGRILYPFEVRKPNYSLNAGLCTWLLRNKKQHQLKSGYSQPADQQKNDNHMVVPNEHNKPQTTFEVPKWNYIPNAALCTWLTMSKKQQPLKSQYSQPANQQKSDNQMIVPDEHSEPQTTLSVQPQKTLSNKLISGNYIKYMLQYKALRNKTTTLSDGMIKIHPPKNISYIQAPTFLSHQEKLIFDLINQERRIRGINQLTINEAVTNLSRFKAQEISKLDYSGHISPNYGDPGRMLDHAGVNFSYYGENICRAEDVKKAHALLMGNEHHKNVILDPNYTQIGVGVAHNQADPEFVVVELLLRP